MKGKNIPWTPEEIKFLLNPNCDLSTASIWQTPVELQTNLNALFGNNRSMAAIHRKRSNLYFGCDFSMIKPRRFGYHQDMNKIIKRAMEAHRKWLKQH